MLSPKGRGRHSGRGTAYYWCLAVVFVTMSVLSIMRWTEDYHLFALGVLSFTAASIGRVALRGRWEGWVRIHISCMGSLTFSFLTAFYVDNSPNLPLWRELPSITYWLLPSAVGLPLIIRAFVGHPWYAGRMIELTPAALHDRAAQGTCDVRAHRRSRRIAAHSRKKSRSEARDANRGQ
jgi:hypothetical protein